MLRLGCFALLVGVVLGLELKLDLKDEWEKFKSTYGKKYSGAEEEGKRQEIFEKNIETIVHHNLKHDMGDSSFRQGINIFSDMSHEEFVKNMNGVRGPRTHKRNKKIFKRAKRATLPHSLDWRDWMAVSPVKDQGSTCGDCWAFSATGAIESAWALANGYMVVLSDQQLTDCANNSMYDCDGCNGGWPDEAMQYVIDNKGQDKEKCYPDLFTQNSQCMYQPSCAAVTISDYVDVQPGSEHVLKEAVGTIGPISVCMDASQPDFQNYQTGIYSNPNCSRTVVDHAVLLIGYGTENGQDYWLLKNSYGTWWGQRGYFQMARNDNDMCAITQYASYPIV